jgi:hypothetical protein
MPAMPATAIVASFALVVSLFSLGWQVVSWRRTGPVIVVKSTNAFPAYGSSVGDHHISAEATNRGRAPATIEGWGFELPDGRSIVPNGEQLPGVASLPHRLDPFTSASWYILAADIRRVAEEQGVHPSLLRPFVLVAGQGKKIGKKGVPLGD